MAETVLQLGLLAVCFSLAPAQYWHFSRRLKRQSQKRQEEWDHERFTKHPPAPGSWRDPNLFPLERG